MGSSGGGDSETTVRYAPYIEDKHSSFLDTMRTEINEAIDSSPFEGFSSISSDDAFFGTGYVLSNFPSLYDMYGKFVAGLDIDALYRQLFEDTMDSSETNALINAEATLLSDDIEAVEIPRLQMGLRDINSVMSSSFIIGKAMLEETRQKALSKFSGELKFRLIPVVNERWQAHLSWNSKVILTYAEIIKLYFASKMDVEDFNYSMLAKNTLWPFTVLAYERAALGAMQGATTATSGAEGASSTQKAIGGAMTGAAAGYMMSGGNPLGAVAGGVLGLGASFL